ncbi:MAG: hypothetical protein HY334_03785 [Armatimonadetes bacterium]|nr:hypothetical protein [Armatimonadota bacterium]
MSQPYTFPAAPAPEAIEWPGTPIGAGNVITRTRTRTALSDKAIDRLPGRREELVAAAVRHAQGRAATWTHDVIIHGVRVRATTNSVHLYEFWVDNWYSPEEWRAVTGTTPPADPQVTVYAMGQVAEQQEAAYYSRRTSTIVFFNTAYYGQLKSWVLGAVGRVLAEEHGIHSVHGACVEKDGRGVLYIAPTGTGKSTSSYGLVGYPRTRFHSDDWVYVRYTYATRDGRRIHPVRITSPRGEEARGYRVFRWLADRGPVTPEATVQGLDLQNREVTVPLAALDLEAPIQAYAFTSEKIFYLRTNLVENFPLSADEMLASQMENVPDVTDAYLRESAPLLDDLVEAIRGGGREAGALRTMDAARLRTLLARMMAFDNARAMLDMTRVLPTDRVFSNPMEPAHLASVILLKRDRRDATVVEGLGLEEFLGRLLIGETPERRREIAYNAYRAVNDAVEATYLADLERETVGRVGEGYPAAALAETFAARRDVPETLEEEFELFRVMHRACRCYDLNTILTADPRVEDKKEAVALTMRVIARLVDTLPERIHHTLESYRDVIGAGEAAPR